MISSIVANPGGRRHGAAHALHAAFAGSDGAFAFKGAGSGGQHNVGQFGGLGIEKVLDQQEFKSAQSLEGAVPVGLGVRGIFART